MSTETASPGMTRASASVRICNERGLHARPAARFVQSAEGFAATITVTLAGQTVSGRSILGLMMLGAALDCELQIAAEGADAAEAVRALADLIARGFDEQTTENNPH